MLPDSLIHWLADANHPQRAKLTQLREHYVPLIRAYHDDDYVRVVREIKKRLNSRKLAAEVAAIVAALDAGRPANPRPAAPAPASPIALAPPPSRPQDTGAELEAAIAADPESRDNYLVFGDWLATQGDPRGQLVTIGAELAKAPGHKAMLAAHARHLEDHGDVILGPLATCWDMVTEVEWHMGFIRRCRVASTFDRYNNRLPSVRVADLVRALVDDPGPGRFLQDLTVGIVRHDDNSYEDVCWVLAQRRRPSLRRLVLGDFQSNETELNWSRIGDISALWSAVPELRELTLRSGSMTLGPLDLPKLERLATITGGLDAAATRAIGHARWPSLVSASLMIGPGAEDACTDPEALLPLLRGDHAPRLRALGVINCEFTDEVCRILARSELTPRLTELDLSMGTLSDDGARVIAEHRDRFAHLRLVVDDNYLTPDGIARLQGITRELVAGAQRDDEGDPANRYAAMYE